MKRIALLGSTGSIGRQTLEVVGEQEGIEVVALTANTSVEVVLEQCRIYEPKLVAMMEMVAADQVLEGLVALGLHDRIQVRSGMEGLIEAVTMESVDIVVTAVVGMIGLKPTVEAIKAGKDIALANKETLVTAGNIIMPLIKEYGVQLLPVDSEHSAIFQSMNGENAKAVESITITASGGPFRGFSSEELKHVTKEQALKHPNWAMGAKITIDSSTLVNKGLEVIEAKWLFDLTPDQIDVVVHPQSIVHSLVTYIDGSVIAQLGLPDMKLPIQYALGYPTRCKNQYRRLKLSEIGHLTFEEADTITFKGLALAFYALRQGGALSIVYNAANEVAVEMFLKDLIDYYQITELIEEAMISSNFDEAKTVEEVLEVEAWTRDYVRNKVK